MWEGTVSNAKCNNLCGEEVSNPNCNYLTLPCPCEALLAGILTTRVALLPENLHDTQVDYWWRVLEQALRKAGGSLGPAGSEDPTLETRREILTMLFKQFCGCEEGRRCAQCEYNILCAEVLQHKIEDSPHPVASYIALIAVLCANCKPLPPAWILFQVLARCMSGSPGPTALTLT